MADNQGRAELGGMSAAGGGREGAPEDVEKSVKERVEARGIAVGSEDFDAMTGETPHVGPTAGGG